MVVAEYIRFDTLGDQPVDDYGYIRFDRNCTPGKTIPCGNACRAPQNCKKKGGAATAAPVAARTGGSRLEELRSKYQTKSGNLNAKAKRALTRASDPFGETESASTALMESRKARAAKGATKTERTAASREYAAKQRLSEATKTGSRLGKQSLDIRKKQGKYNPEYEAVSRKMASNEDRIASAESTIKKNRMKRRRDSEGNWIYEYE